MISGTSLFFGLFNNLAIFIVMVAVYGLLIGRFKSPTGYRRQAVLGIFFGLFAAGCMYIKLHVAEGVIVDQRNAIVALSGAFGGPLAALISAIITAANRIQLGGAGVLAGTVGVGLSAVAGTVLYKVLGPKDSVWKGACGALAATLFILPGFLLYEDLQTGWALLKTVALPYGTAIFLGMFLVGLLLAREDRQHLSELEKELATERLRDFAESASDWFWELDQDLRFTFVSERFEKLVGHPIADVIGKQRCELADPELAAEIWPVHQADLLARKPFRNFEYPFKLNNGQVAYFSASGVPVFDKQGNFTGYRGSTSDISERKHMEQKILTSDRSKSEFIATASHELRTPLAVVLGYSELLMESDHFTLEERREYLSYISDKGHVLEKLVDELLDMSRIESGHMVCLERAPVNVFAVAKQVLPRFHQESSRCRFTLSFPDEQLQIFADRGKLVQVLENLIGNAIKFSPQGGEISISGEAIDGQYRMMVADQGIGMNTEQQHKVFEKFYRIDASDTATKGLGIGLYLARNIIEAHQGKIWLESAPGEGTRFFFTLPL